MTSNRMRVPLGSVLVLLLFGQVLTGCSALERRYTPGEKGISFAGAGTVYAPETHVELSLCNELIKFGLAEYRNDVELEPKVSSRAFFRRIPESPDGICLMETDPDRKQVASFLSYSMGLSDLKCGIYKQELLRKRSVFSSRMLSLATLFAGAGSVVSHLETAQAFSAASGAASGINAVSSQEKFANLASEVITAGIDQRRLELARKITEDASADWYNTGWAIRDVMAYHAACDTLAGLQSAADAIERVDDPGISKLKGIVSTLKSSGLNFSGSSTAEQVETQAPVVSE